jgi:predicted acylesterase/phospholipase RssA
MKALSMSGGGTKIAGLLGAVEALNEQFDIVAGVSAGAIMVPIVGCNKIQEAKKVILNLKLSDIFSEKPVNKNGAITVNAILNVAKGKTYLGKIDNLLVTLSDTITELDWHWSAKPIMLVQSVDMEDGHRWIENIKNVSRPEAFRAIKASASIPVFVDGVNSYFDGGLRNHNPSRAIIERYGSELTELVSIYTRPENLSEAIDQEYEPSNVLDVLKRSIEIMSIEISKRDAEYEKEKAKELGFKLRQIFLPIRSNGFYDISEMKTMYQDSYNFIPQL